MIKTGIWVHPTKGNFDSGTWFLCVSDPYEDSQEWKRQKDYWKNKYNVELSEKNLVKVQLFRKEIVQKQSGEITQLSPYSKKPYIYPIECLEEDKTKERDYDKLKKKYEELKREKEELEDTYAKKDLESLKEQLYAVNGLLERVDEDDSDRKEELLEKKEKISERKLILKVFLDEGNFPSQVSEEEVEEAVMDYLEGRGGEIDPGDASEELEYSKGKIEATITRLRRKEKIEPE